jgi:anti-anti-sigma regulatory factor
MALTTTTDEVAGRVPITVVSLEGELDASNFERLIDDAHGLYAAGTRNLLIDLSGLTFLASSGLVALHSIVRILHGEPPPDLESGWGALHELGLDTGEGSTQREVQLAGPQPAVARVLQRTGLDRLFVVHADRAAGIADF